MGNCISRKRKVPLFLDPNDYYMYKTKSEIVEQYGTVEQFMDLGGQRTFVRM